MADIYIFHTSDIHNRLDRKQAILLKEMKASVDNALLLDSGDAIRSGNITFNPLGETALSTMSEAGYDAMCVGNREYHFLSTPMKAKIAKAVFPVLSANLVTKNGNVNLEPYIDFIRDGVKLRVFGLSVPCVTEGMLVQKFSNQYFLDPVKFGVEIAENLRKDCDILVALTHIGLDKDIELAKGTQHIDLILGGHTHIVTEEPVFVGKTSILHHGFYAKSVGRIKLHFEAGFLRVVNELLELSK